MVDRDLFIAVTSHELRTPVTVIKGFADTLVEHWDALDPAGRRAAVRVIRQRATDLARLVDRLLAATTEPPGSPAHAPFDLLTALREAIDGLCDQLRGRLRVMLPPTLAKAYGDRASLATVVTELVTNAAKYSSGVVELRADADEQMVQFQVSDRGIGIAPEHVERAFIRYWQADSGDRREHSGAGLGLYLVRQIVERQDGRVSLRPRDGGGTVAEVRLPRADAVVAAVRQASEEA
jgi:signal transduction histidine kinase